MTKTTSPKFRTETVMTGDVFYEAGPNFDQTFGPVVGKSLSNDNVVIDAEGNELDVTKQLRYGFIVTRMMEVGEAMALATTQYAQYSGAPRNYGFPEDEMTRYNLDQKTAYYKHEMERLAVEMSEVTA